MNLLQRWVRQPQNVWLRRALFQVHLWTGIGLGIYVFVISISGSVVIFRSELYNKFTPQIIDVGAAGTRLTDDQLTAAAQREYPGFVVTNIWKSRKATQPIEIWLEHDDEKRQRNFNPYTGEDLGNSVPPGIRIVSWLLDLHDNLLGGDTGRFVNGVGGFLLTGLCLTGAVIWWPGIKNWRRSLFVHRTAGWKRFNWDLHSAIGLWSFVLVFIWGISGAYLAIPNPFNIVVDFLQPPNSESFEPRFADDLLVWLGRLHFGRYYGMPMKITWAVLGLIPPVLFVTGAVMWWNRVLRPRLVRDAAEYRHPASQIIPRPGESDI